MDIIHVHTIDVKLIGVGFKRFLTLGTLYINGVDTMILTVRDKNFLKDLIMVKYLNTKRICKLYNGNHKSTMRRLKQLETNGYIKVLDYVGNRENVYCITRKGCTVLGLNFSCVKKVDKLKHYLGCADFYFSVKDKGIKELLYEHQYYYTLNGKKYSFRPDLVVKIDRWYFIEIDLCGRRFENKVKIWEGYYNSGAFKREFDKYPPVVIVSVNVDKVKGIIDKCRDERIGLNYVYKDYEEVMNWDYRY